ncbi:hypothetical protein PaG_03781 [Moesziomyces aphidis]|uniref:Uncharacterized protein n=1 Tax=Moesziomyces aphidis TaxID=84754 RepID=W3VN52_MOEAP|nr:hypothetical protein PaG_03781 [Moesziomyces aphidis]
MLRSSLLLFCSFRSVHRRVHQSSIWHLLTIFLLHPRIQPGQTSSPSPFIPSSIPHSTPSHRIAPHFTALCALLHRSAPHHRRLSTIICAGAVRHPFRGLSSYSSATPASRLLLRIASPRSSLQAVAAPLPDHTVDASIDSGPHRLARAPCQVATQVAASDSSQGPAKQSHRALCWSLAHHPP